jgi:Fe-S-cluster containining protein
MPVKVNMPQNPESQTRNPKPQAGCREPETENPNMCLGCGGWCCRGPTVDLTTYDMFRIVLAENKPPDEFMTLIFAAPNDAFAFRCNQGMVKMVVRQNTGICVFLRPQETLKCAIEGSKPSICLSYPFWFRDGRPFLRTDVLCPPANRKMVDYKKMSAKTLEDCDWEARRYREIADDWNLMAKGDEPPDRFLMFAAKEMELELSPWGSACRAMKRRLLRAFRRP